MDRFNLKTMSKDGVPAALAKAQRYRLLNEPGEAESICLDILQVDPHNEDALVMMLLALTDQFPHDLSSKTAARANELAATLATPYDRAYYAGIIRERRAKAILQRRLPGVWITTSAEVVPEFREYERFSTTVINAYLLPVMDRYISALTTKLSGSFSKSMRDKNVSASSSDAPSRPGPRY